MLNVLKEVLIDAPANKVWEVLIAPKFIRQWTVLPADFQDYYLETGRVIEWVGSSKMIVTEMIAQHTLKQSLYETKWGISPSECDISCTYTLNIKSDRILLSLEIGDFAQLEEGETAFNFYTDFAEKALNKIKALAENRV